jgi:hypothetical protein
VPPAALVVPRSEPRPSAAAAAAPDYEMLGCECEMHGRSIVTADSTISVASRDISPGA